MGKNQLFSLLFVILFILTMFIGSIGIKDNTILILLKSINNDEIIVVNNNGDGDYCTIQDAITNATDGDTIIVFPGIYYENPIIDKKIQLIGADRNKTIIDGCYKPNVIHIQNKDVKLQNFTIRNSGGHQKNSGIIVNASRILIESCILNRNKIGILIEEKNQNIIRNCAFHNNGEGIHLFKTIDSNIDSCIFFHNSIGTTIESSFDSTINYSSFHTKVSQYFVNIRQ